jgi:cell division protein FtsN
MIPLRNSMIILRLAFVYCIIIFSGIAFVMQACKSPGVITEKPDYEPSVSIFTAREDTVKVLALDVEDSDHTTATETTDVIYYAVQIGAYRLPLNAERTRRLAQERFADMESHTEFNPDEGLYKITIGSFETYEQARTFREQMIKHYPSEYIDAWIVSMTQKPRKL